MTYTTHGHHIPGTPLEERPADLKVARCGGVKFCKVCIGEHLFGISPKPKLEIPEPDSNEVFLGELLKGLVDEIRRKQEEALIKFFGSLEEAKKQIHLYVIEEEPIEYELPDFMADNTAYRLRHTWRIRPKTAEELLEEQADES